MSSGYTWKIPDMPHRGWSLVEVIDLEEATHTCDACEFTPIRYVHVIDHAEFRTLEVGCVCSEHLTEDYVNPREWERRLRNRAAAKSRWFGKEWNLSPKGAWWIKQKGHHVAVFPSRFGDGWRCSFDGEFGRLTHATKEDAMNAVFRKYWATTTEGATP